MTEKGLEKFTKFSKNPEAICLTFDFDGTLAETEEAYREAFKSAFSEKKLKWYWNKFVYKKLTSSSRRQRKN